MATVPGEARGYSWAAFEPGHELSLRHGAHSERVWGPLAAQRREELVTDEAPDLARPRWTGVVDDLAATEAQIHLLRAYLDGVGLLDESGTPRPALAALERAQGHARRLRNDMALTPMSLAKLLSDLAATPSAADDDGLEQLRAEGQRIVAARFAELQPPPDEPEDVDDKDQADDTDDNDDTDDTEQPTQED